MKLGDIVKAYREEHDLSQRQFAAACDLSNGYISMLEKDINPKTGLPMLPSLLAVKKIADGMHISVNDLLDQMDDLPIAMEDDTAEESEEPTIPEDGGLTTEFIELFERMPADKQALIVQEMKGLLKDL